MKVETTGGRIGINEGALRLRLGGVRGERGPGGGGAEGAGGLIASNAVWLIHHDLDLTEEELNPGMFWFEDLSGNPMEPVEVLWSNNDTALAVWDGPRPGRWRYK